MARKPPDWTKTGTVGGYAEYLRQNSNALCVVVIRVNDAVLACDAKLAPADARQLVLERMPDLAANVEAARKAGKAAARVELEAVRE